MKNLVQEGCTLTLAAPYAVTSGDGFLVGAIFAVASNTAALGADVEGVRRGVFDLKAASADTPTAGAKAYWDNSAKQLTTTSAGNTLVGAFHTAKAAGVTVGRVVLDGAIR